MSAVLLLSLVIAFFLASPALAAVIIERGPANIRSGPGTQHPVISTMPVGQTLEETGKSGDWFKVRLADGREGFVLSSLVRLESAVPGNTIIVPNSTINIRSGPGTSYAIVGKAEAGAAMNVTASSGQWSKVRFDNKEGFVATWLCTIKTVEPSQFESGDIERKVVVLKNGTRVRSGPSENFGTVLTLNAGAQADYLASSDGWHRIRTSGGVTGWVDATDLRVFSVDSRHGASYVIGDDFWEMRIAPSGKTTSNVNLRQSPTTSARIIQTLNKGQAFRVIGEQSGWYNIQTGNLTGWVAGWLVRIDPARGPSSIRLDRKPQSKTLTIRGAFPTAPIVQFNPLSLGIIATPNEGTKGRLEIFAAEVGSIELGATGLLVSFTEKPSYKVVESRPGLLRLEMYQTIDNLSYSDGPKSGLRLETSGAPEPVATFDEAAGRIVVRFDGATIARPQNLPARGQIQGVTARDVQGGTTVEIRVPPDSQYNLRRSPNLLIVDVLQKGLSGKIICIDPGHGGNDPGAIGQGGLLEKTPNLAISLALKALLEQAGAKVVMTRTTDSENPTLAARMKIASDSQADLILSIHNNSNLDRSKEGTTTFYAETSLNSERSMRLGGFVQRSLVDALGRLDNGVRASELFVCRNAPVTAVVAEVVFISNRAEEALLADKNFLSRASNALFQALRQYYGE